MASTQTPDKGEVKYSVFIRVPFPRGEFVDPPAVNWNTEKDSDLWKVLSSTAKGTDIDWHELSDKYDVTLAFLLQQAAWLYEQQLSQVREQLRKVNKPLTTTSPAPGSLAGSNAAGGIDMKRDGSGGTCRSTLFSCTDQAYQQASRAPSTLTVRARGSTNFDGSTHSVQSTPLQMNIRAPDSRATSTNSITQIQRSSPEKTNTLSTSPRRPRVSFDREKARPQLVPEAESEAKRPSRNSRRSSSPSDSSSDEVTTAPVMYSRTFSRRPRFSALPRRSALPLNSLLSEESTSDASDTFLPFSTQANPIEAPSPTRSHSPSATLRHTHAARPPASTTTTTTTTTTSATSSNPISSSIPSIASPNPRLALSPHLQQRLAREGSEGTPSMGSSFSDLDDESVTRSALEEALVREMRAGRGSLGVMGGLVGWRGGQGGGRG